jgi:hypothetical protein
MYVLSVEVRLLSAKNYTKYNIHVYLVLSSGVFKMASTVLLPANRKIIRIVKKNTYKIEEYKIIKRL